MARTVEHCRVQCDMISIESSQR